MSRKYKYGDNDRMSFLLPFNRELKRPYRVHEEVNDKLLYLFTHPTRPKRKVELFKKVNEITNNATLYTMGGLAYALTKEFLDHPNRYGGKWDYVHFQVLYRTWRILFRYRKHDVSSYMTAELGLLDISDSCNLVETLFDAVRNDKCWWTNDDMVKRREGVRLRERRGLGTHEGSSNFNYLCDLAEREVVGGYLTDLQYNIRV